MQNPLAPMTHNRVFVGSTDGWTEVLDGPVPLRPAPGTGLRIAGVGSFSLPLHAPMLRVAASYAGHIVRWPATGSSNLGVKAVIVIDRAWHLLLNTGEVLGPQLRKIMVAGVGEVSLPRAASGLRLVMGKNRGAP